MVLKINDGFVVLISILNRLLRIFLNLFHLLLHLELLFLLLDTSLDSSFHLFNRAFFLIKTDDFDFNLVVAFVLSFSPEFYGRGHSFSGVEFLVGLDKLHSTVVLLKLDLLDLGQSSHSSGLFNRLVYHNSNVDCNHHGDENYHGKAHIELLVVVKIESSEAYEVVQLDQAEEVVDHIHDIV